MIFRIAVAIEMKFCSDVIVFIQRSVNTFSNVFFLESQTYSSIQDDSFVSEAISTAKDDSVKKSVTETPQTAISVESSPEEAKRGAGGARNKTSLGRSASESSIPEEVLSQSSVDESPVTPKR